MNIRKQMLSGVLGCLVSLSIAVSFASGAEAAGRILKAGMTGEDVQQVQAQLLRQGYQSGTADGIYGQLTKAAVIALQQEKKLKADGLVGSETLNALREKTEAGSRGKTPDGYKKEHNIVATAYAPGVEDNGQWGNYTHIGTLVRPGVIAVDPQIIPLGSRVYIEFADGQGMYAVAEDTGGAIKGNRIDIAFQTRDEAKQFGIQDVKLFVLDKK